MQSDREVQRSSADPMPTSPSTSLLKCDKCARTFTRSEHLNRHIRSHTRERPFGCSVCSKKFSRTDILYRHQKAHQPDETEKASRAATGTFRACLECASARAKCSGGNPCQRCSVRSGNCQYPPKKRQKTSAANDVEQVAEVSTQNDHVDYSAQVGATGDMMATEDTVRSHASVSGAPWSERPLSAGIYENLWPQSAANLTASHLNPTRGFRDLAAIVPSNELPRSSWTNGAMQTPADNSIHGQYDSFEDNGNFPMFRSEQQFINREFSSINWLPPSDPTFEDWDFGAASLGGLIPANRDNVLAIPGDIRQSNTLPDIMANFTNHETSYQSPNRGSGNDHISPSEIAPVSISSDNYSNPAENQDRRSGYYVDGAGGRVTASARLRRNRSKSKDPISQHSGSNSVNHIVSSAPQTEYESEKSHVWITMETYEEILNNSHTASCQTPPWNVLNGLIQLYFDKFHCVFPLLYKRYFGQRRGEWILVLAAAAVGAAYGGTLESRQCSEKLHECLRKTLDILDPPLDCGNQMLGIVPWNDQNQENSIMLAQARILNVIGMLHSGNQNLVRLAHSGRSALTTACYNMDLLRPADRIYLNDGLGVEDKQREWLTEQMRIRTGYFIWMVDCMVAYESDFRPQMKLIDAKAPLPCSDVAWEDKELNKAPMWDPKNEPPALCTAVDVLYMEKKILPNVGDLGRILIIHAIYHRTWDVSNYHREKLSSWIPTAKIESIADFPSQAESWLPSIPTVSRWRNIACDAFDILHWSANSVVAGAAGLEHPIILHLHLARLILLTPVTQIQQLGSSILRSSSQQSRTPHTLSLDRKKECEARNEILRWVVQDQYKARLSIIHAAAIFWNTRRYSYDSPVEPFAIYLATLVIWAYSTFVRVSVQRRHLSGNGTTIEAIISEEIQNENATARGPNLPPSPHPPMSASPRPKRSPSPEPSFLHLDRPCDNELVQTFVRLGHKMTGHMVRIGDICGAAAAGRVLREGARRLSGIQQQDSSEEHEGGPDRCVEGRQVTWGLSETFKGCLERLAGIVEE